MSRTKSPTKISAFPVNTFVRITACGGRFGDWWRRVALTGATQEKGGYHDTIIQVIHPETGELTQLPWRTEWLEVLPDGEQLEDVENLNRAIAVSNSGSTNQNSNSSSQENEKSQRILKSELASPDTTSIHSAARTDITSTVIEEAASAPEFALGLADDSSDHKLETGSQTFTQQEMSDLASSGDVTPSSAVEVIEELTESEATERHRLELKVERAFFEAGKALAELRNLRLYRDTHRTFEEYCRDRFNYTRDTAYLKIAAAVVYENLQEFLPTIGRQIPMPTSERQLRDLAKANFPPETQAAAWLQGVESAGGKIPSGRIVKGIVERLKEKPLFKATDFCHPGDVFILSRLEGTERKYNGYWAIATDLRDFTVEVEVHDDKLNVKPENLDPIDSPDIRRQLPQILKRIKRLRKVGLLDRFAYTTLDHLGRQTYLTLVEEKVLSCLEAHYGVSDG